jgi:hypothetical protein
LWFSLQRTAAGFVSGNRFAVSGRYFALGGHIYGLVNAASRLAEGAAVRADVIKERPVLAAGPALLRETQS